MSWYFARISGELCPLRQACCCVLRIRRLDGDGGQRLRSSMLLSPMIMRAMMVGSRLASISVRRIRNSTTPRQSRLRRGLTARRAARTAIPFGIESGTPRWQVGFSILFERVVEGISWVWGNRSSAARTSGPHVVGGNAPELRFFFSAGTSGIASVFATSSPTSPGPGTLWLGAKHDRYGERSRLS